MTLVLVEQLLLDTQVLDYRFYGKTPESPTTMIVPYWHWPILYQEKTAYNRYTISYNQLLQYHTISYNIIQYHTISRMIGSSAVLVAIVWMMVVVFFFAEEFAQCRCGWKYCHLWDCSSVDLLMPAFDPTSTCSEFKCKLDRFYKIKMINIEIK